MNFDDLSLRLIDECQPVTIFKADKVVTMDPERPYAEAVARFQPYEQLQAEQHTLLG